MQAPMGSLKARLGQFVMERFSPVAYGPLVLALILAGQAGAALAGNHGLELTGATGSAVLAVAIGFLVLRTLDDVRDAETDRVGRPDRPVPRGLVSASELRMFAAGATVVGVVIAVTLGIAALACYALALGQIWLLSSPAGRAVPSPGGIVADALIHSLIVPTMLAVAWASAGPLVLHPILVATLLLAWGAGLALEVGRKTVTTGEERAGVETYSRALGRPRALALLAGFLCTTALAAALLAETAEAVAVVVALPIAIIAAAIAVAAISGGRVGTATIRSAVPVLVLAALVWPPLLAWALR